MGWLEMVVDIGGRLFGGMGYVWGLVCRMIN